MHTAHVRGKKCWWHDDERHYGLEEFYTVLRNVGFYRGQSGVIRDWFEFMFRILQQCFCTLLANKIG